ncbi:MAG: hypothetical protein JXX29_10555 [Deltaproteobacteria bacterium]|nr:hypothetical protein [Deltaproteobacteria bacterium]MBN2672108.1 hypothetical protein [Deltaproteobacteria bacterium]
MAQKLSNITMFTIIALVMAVGIGGLVIGCDDSSDDNGTDSDTDSETGSDSGTDTGSGDSDTGTGQDTDTAVFPPDVSAPRIMIVGDSISAGPGCYKSFLKENLDENGYTAFEFVGEYEDDCGYGDVMHSAVSCTTTSDFKQDPTFPRPVNCPDLPLEEYPGMSTLVATHNPDLVMIQLGTNDVWGGTALIPLLLNNFTTLIDQARAHNPNMVFAVAMIHQIITDNCTNTASTENAQEFNEALPAWAEEHSMANSPIFIADLWTNSDPENSNDCVHPNTDGARQMGLDWYNTLKDILPQ